MIKIKYIHGKSVTPSFVKSIFPLDDRPQDKYRYNIMISEHFDAFFEVFLTFIIGYTKLM